MFAPIFQAYEFVLAYIPYSQSYGYVGFPLLFFVLYYGMGKLPFFNKLLILRYHPILGLFSRFAVIVHEGSHAIMGLITGKKIAWRQSKFLVWGSFNKAQNGDPNAWPHVTFVGHYARDMLRHYSLWHVVVSPLLYLWYQASNILTGIAPMIGNILLLYGAYILLFSVWMQDTSLWAFALYPSLSFLLLVLSLALVSESQLSESDEKAARPGLLGLLVLHLCLVGYFGISFGTTFLFFVFFVYTLLLLFLKVFGRVLHGVIVRHGYVFNVLFVLSLIDIVGLMLASTGVFPEYQDIRNAFL